MIKLDSCKKVVIYSEIIKGDDMSTNDSKAPQWFVNFEEKNDAHWDKQEVFNSEQRIFNKEIKDEIHHIKQDVQLILSLPTIKQEINTLNNE